MNEADMKALVDRLTAASDHDQRRAAEFIRQYPDSPLYDMHPPVGQNATNWASVHVEAGKYADMAHYLSCLAWFYAEVRPTNAMRELIEAKLHVVKRGAATKDFWKALGEFENV